jgi:hypothetical protein
MESDTVTPTVTKRVWSGAALGTVLAIAVVVGVVLSLRADRDAADVAAPLPTAHEPIDEPGKEASAEPIASIAEDAGTTVPSVSIPPPHAVSAPRETPEPPAPKSKVPVKGAEDYGF